MHIGELELYYDGASEMIPLKSDIAFILQKNSGDGKFNMHRVFDVYIDNNRYAYFQSNVVNAYEGRAYLFVRYFNDRRLINYHSKFDKVLKSYVRS